MSWKRFIHTWLTVGLAGRLALFSLMENEPKTRERIEEPINVEERRELVSYDNTKDVKPEQRRVEYRRLYGERVERYGNIVGQIAPKEGVPPELVLYMIEKESSGNSRATSREGAMGLMQLMPATARELGVKNPYNPRENISGGTRYLAYLIDKYGSEREALAAYNLGENRLDRFIAIHGSDWIRRVPKETRGYIRPFLDFGE